MTRLRFLVVAACAAALLLVPAAGAFTLSPLPFATNGQVFAFARDGNTLYIGGRFSRVGPVTGSGLRVDAATGAQQGTPLRIVGPVYAAVSDGAGGEYLGGSFSSIGGVAVSNLAHVTAAGQVDTTFAGSADAPVRALALSGQTLWVGGDFSHLGATGRGHLGALDATTGAVGPFAVGTDGAVRALALAGGRLYIGGTFSAVGYASVRNVASIDAAAGEPDQSSVSTTYDPAPNGPVDTLVPAPDGSLYVGGSFSVIGGQSLSDLARVASDGTVSTTWTPNPNGEVRTALLMGTTLYAGGAFTTIGGQPAARLAAVSTADGTASASFTPNPDAPVFALAPGASGSVLAGGQFTTIGGAARHGVARLSTADGSAAPGFRPDPDRAVLALAPTTGGGLFIGGDFASAGGVTRKNIAAIDLTTNTVTAFDPSADETSANTDRYVNAIALAGGRVWIGGQFDRLGGQPHANLGAAAPDGTVSSLNLDTGAAVAVLTADGDTVYAGGYFTQLAGSYHGRIAKIDATTGAVDQGFMTDGFNGDVHAIVPDGASLFVGGNFNYIGYGDNVGPLVELTKSTGTHVGAFAMTSNATVYSVARAGGAVYASGNQQVWDNTRPGALAKLDPATGAVDPAFAPGFGGEVNTLLSAGSDLYAIGCFAQAGNREVDQITRFDPATGVPYDDGLIAADLAPDFDDYPRDYYQTPGCLIGGIASADGSTIYAGGAFDAIGGVPQGGITAISTADAPAPDLGDGDAPGGSVDDDGGLPGPAQGGTPFAVSADPVVVQVASVATSTPATAAPAFVTTRAPTVSATRRVDAGFAATCPAACTLALSATTQSRPARNVKPPPYAAGRARRSVAAGRQGEATFTLPTKVYAYLKAHHSLTLAVAATATGAGAKVTARRTLVLTLSKPKKKKAKKS